MAEYSAKMGFMDEAGEEFSALAGNLDLYRERIDEVISKWPENIDKPRQELSKTRNSVSELARQTHRAGKVLHDAAGCYKRAERSAIGEQNCILRPHFAKRQNAAIPIAQASPSMMIFGERPLPDWLVSAMLKFEQSAWRADANGEARGGREP